MNYLEELKPTHLSVFALEKGTGYPIAGLPCYAEIQVASVQESMVERDDKFTRAIIHAASQQDDTCDGDCLQMLIVVLSDILSRLLDTETRKRLHESSADEERLLTDILMRALSIAGVQTLKGMDVERLKDVLEKAVRQVAEESDLRLTQPPVEEQRKWSHPLGVVVTNHVGYLSFDLTRLSQEIYSVLLSAVQVRHGESSAATEVSIWIYPLFRDDLRIDALTQNRLAHDAIVARLELEPLDLPDVLKHMGLLSMQKPGLTDWRLSPASFATNPGVLVGEAGCETILPANVAIQEFFFYQVVRLNDAALLQLIPDNLRTIVRLGIVHEYRLAWYSLGHSLGQILYSLPLAPGESVNLAVIDWTRRDDAQRKEHTTVDEQIVHNEHRDRTITETVNAALNEYQHGSTFMGGIAGSVGWNSPIGPAAGVAGSLGGSTASSNGSRDLAATTVQKLSDNISQASASMRELQSTVVVHSVQAEKEAIETRTVVNYNHSHALTILYYEVLRHFRVVTEVVRARPAVLVKVATNWFEGKDAEQNILENRAALEAALLDPKYVEGFNALQRIAHRTAQQTQLQNEKTEHPLPKPPVPPPYVIPAYPGDREFIYYTFAITTGGYYSSNEQHVDIAARLVGPGLNVKLYHPIRPKEDQNLWFLNQPGSFRAPDQTNTFVAVNPPVELNFPPVLWKTVTSLFLDIMVHRCNVSFKHVKLIARDTTGADTVLIDQGYDDGHIIITESTTIVLPTRQSDPLPTPVPRPAEEIEDDVKKDELLTHLKYHNAYYSRTILLKRNEIDRARELDAIKLNGSSVLEHIENRPLELIGDYLAYPCTDPTWSENILTLLQGQMRPVRAQPEEKKPLSEQLITLPTRGVFAEAKLGHCNASEEIDNTRFWDWQQSPIPHLAPAINPVTPVTPQPQKQDLAPTAFPSSLVNIVNPSAAPDPTGLAAALNVLGTPNIFRDMSGRAEVADLLKKLSDNTIGITDASAKAKAIQSKYGDGLTGGGLGSGGASGYSGGGRATGGGTSGPTPSEQHDQMQVLRNAESHGDITEPQRQQLADMYLTNALAPSPAMSPFPAPPPPRVDPNIFQFKVTIQDDGSGPSGGWMETGCLEFGFTHAGPSGTLKQPIPLRIGVPLRNKQHGKISVRFAQQEAADAAWFAAVLCKQALDNNVVTDGPALVLLFRKVMQEDLGGSDLMPGKINGARVTSCSGGSKQVATFYSSSDGLIYVSNQNSEGGDV